MTDQGKVLIVLFVFVFISSLRGRAFGFYGRGNLEVKGDCFVGKDMPPRNDKTHSASHCERSEAVAVSKSIQSSHAN
jgi:hypothetical protein